MHIDIYVDIHIHSDSHSHCRHHFRFRPSKQINLALNYCFNKNLFLKCTSIISKHSHSDVELHLLLVTGL